MILNNNYKTIEIDITTYKKEQRDNHYNMNETERSFRTTNENRFICSICLNKKSFQEDNRIVECCKKKTKSCPICQKHCEIDENKNGHKKNEHRCREDKVKKSPDKFDNKDINGKNIQTSQPDVTKGLTLLNEVLTVFQTKKQLDFKKDNMSKTVMVKDAGVETEKSKPKLTFSRTFIYSLGESDEIQKNGIFSIINSEPETAIKSQFSIDLKHKSSSIPQMKIEELKNSLKEKTKSKDAIEEVNRMFATVRKHELGESVDDSNRPLVRNGPRVLPVVKTNNVYQGNKITVRKDIQEYCNCQTFYQMSSGDSMRGCCHKQERYDDCCTCCHYKHRCVEKCDHCCNVNKDCKHTVDIRE